VTHYQITNIKLIGLHECFVCLFVSFLVKKNKIGMLISLEMLQGLESNLKNKY
jgi:hypothetical protein